MPTTFDGEAVFSGEGNFDSRFATTWDGSAVLAGELNYQSCVAVMTLDALAFSWSAAGSLDALGVKPPNRLSARFAGSGGMNVVTIAPRLVASATFVGDGSFATLANSTVNVLSTAASNRYSFPTVPNPGDPFVRRPSKGYKNYSISARFAGAGRVTAVAS